VAQASKTNSRKNTYKGNNRNRFQKRLRKILVNFSLIYSKRILWEQISVQSFS